MARRRRLVGCILAAVASVCTSPAAGQDGNAPRAVVIFLDDFHIDFQNTPNLRTGFKQGTARLLAAGRAVGVVSDGPSAVSTRPTNDSTVLSQIATRISGSGLKPGETTSPTPTVAADMKRREALAEETLQGVLRVAGLQAILYVTERQLQPIAAAVPIVVTRPEGIDAAIVELLSR